MIFKAQWPGCMTCQLQKLKTVYMWRFPHPVLYTFSVDKSQSTSSSCVTPLSGDPVSMLGVWPARKAHIHTAGRYAGETAQAQPQALTPWTLLEIRRVRIVSIGWRCRHTCSVPANIYSTHVRMFQQTWKHEAMSFSQKSFQFTSFTNYQLYTNSIQILTKLNYTITQEFVHPFINIHWLFTYV